MSKPYKDIIKGNTRIREFDHTVESDELVWHRDKNDRVVTIKSGEDWYFQMDNQIPYRVKVGDVLNIPKETYHRIFKAGTSPLKIEIKESGIKSFANFIEK